MGVSMAQIATELMLGATAAELDLASLIEVPYYGVKESVFPFDKFPGSDPVLGPEMKSTGEVLGLADTFSEAYNTCSSQCSI